MPGHQHLVARPDPGGDQRQRERGRAGGHAHALARLAVVGELPLERLDLVAEDERVGAQHPLERRPQLTLQRRVLATQAHERNCPARHPLPDCVSLERPYT